MKGIAKAIIDSVKHDILPSKAVDDLVMIAHVFVHPTASNPKRVEVNNYKAMRYAIREAIEGRPTLNGLFRNKRLRKTPIQIYALELYEHHLRGDIYFLFIRVRLRVQLCQFFYCIFKYI